LPTLVIIRGADDGYADPLAVVHDRRNEYEVPLVEGSSPQLVALASLLADVYVKRVVIDR